MNDRSSEASTHGNLAVAYQALGMHDMAIVHYHSHVNIARELKDTAGEACALLNLGNCHSSRGEFAQAVAFYENYLMISQELQDVEGEAKVTVLAKNPCKNDKSIKSYHLVSNVTTVN